MTNPRWQGIFPAITTKFKSDESIDAEGTSRHIDFQIRNGIHGIVTCGSLGEASTLVLEEKLEVARIAVRTADGRVPVLANVSETSTGEALRYIDGANKIGVSGFMVMPSVIYVADAREAMLNVRTMAEAAQSPIMVYNNPVAYRVDRLLEAGGGDRDARSAARHSASEHKHGESSAQRWGAICAPLWRDAERTRAFAFLHAGWGGGAGAGFSWGAGG